MIRTSRGGASGDEDARAVRGLLTRVVLYVACDCFASATREFNRQGRNMFAAQ